MGVKPILFSGAMVRALLSGAKSQTRRIIKPRGRDSLFDGQWTDSYVLDPDNASWREREISTKIGDRLWVRETYFQRGHWEPVKGAVTRKTGRQKWQFVADDPEISFDAPPIYRKGRHPEDPETPAWHQRLGRFMPRWASRITLVVTDVRVQRLQEINEEDARAEGVYSHDSDLGRLFSFSLPGDIARGGSVIAKPAAWSAATHAYAALWEGINRPGSWEANPWVAAYSFTVHQANIDALTMDTAA